MSPRRSSIGINIIALGLICMFVSEVVLEILILDVVSKNLLEFGVVTNYVHALYFRESDSESYAYVSGPAGLTRLYFFLHHPRTMELDLVD